MSKARTLIIALVVAVVLGIGAIATYVIVQNNRAPEALTPNATAPNPSDSSTANNGSQSITGFDPSALSGEWKVGKDSVAGYRVDEVLGGQDVTVVGRTDQVDGTVTVGDSKIQAATISVNVDSVETDSSNRDHEFRKLLGTDQNKDATFIASEPVALTAGQDTYEVQGTLTIAGVQNTTVATITATSSGDVTQLVGNIPVTFTDYGIEAPDMGFVTVEDEGIIEFSLNMERN